MSCEVKIPDAIGPLGKISGEELTVGRSFVLQCQGDWHNFPMKALELRLEEADKYKLKILKAEKNDSNNMQLLVVSYQVGDHHLKAVQLVEGDQSAVLGDLNFKVTSVIQQQEAPPKPFGPIGPVILTIPLWAWVALLTILLALIGGVGVRWYQRRRIRRWLGEMKLGERTLPPIAELGRELRYLLREQPLKIDLKTPANKNCIEKLNQIFLVYLARVFVIPTLKMRDAQILREINRAEPLIFASLGESFAKCFSEIRRGLEVKADIPVYDLEQLVNLIRKTVDAFEAQKRENAK